jgi:two-component system, cell cycle response regulator CtrA
MMSHEVLPGRKSEEEDGDVGTSQTGRQATGLSCVYICETRPALREGLIRELRARRLSPVMMDPETTGPLTKMAEEGVGWMRPFLIPDEGRTPQLISSIRRVAPANPIIVYQDFRRSGRACDLLDAGADFILTLPLRGAEVEARLFTLLRRAYGHSGGRVRIGPLTIPLDRSSPMLGAEPLPLPEAEMSLLRMLALNLDRPVSRELLYETLYESGDQKPFPSIIDRYICNLRRRVSLAAPEIADQITTVPGYGYALRSL